MGTRSETAFLDEEGSVLGVMYCQWDGAPEMAWGNELSSVVSLAGREAKTPDGRLTQDFSRYRCGMVLYPHEDPCEEALDCIRLLKSLSPCGDRRLQSVKPWQIRKGTVKSLEKRVAQHMAQMEENGCPLWLYAVVLSESAPAKIMVKEPGKDGFFFSGTAHEFRQEFGLGPANTLQELWKDAVEASAPLQSVPAGMLTPEICLAAVKRNPMEVEFVPLEHLSPQLCQACGNACFNCNGIPDEALEKATRAIAAMLKEKGAQPDAVKALENAFDAGFKARMKEAEEDDEDIRPKP